MSLNKKQKKQLDVERKKLNSLQQRLAGAKQQLDDPAELTRLQSDVNDCQERIRKIQEN